MRDASECQAKDPRTCPYHGAVITMNESLARMQKNGPNDADLDTYFDSRKKVEQAEEEFRKHQWMDELRASPSTPVQRASRPQRKPGNRPESKAPQRGGSTGGGQNRGAQNRKQSQPRPNRQPMVQAKTPYSIQDFPQQVQLPDENGNQAFFTRHDKAGFVPTGVMLAASRPITDDEREHLLGLLRYQHTVSTREDNKAKTVEESDLVNDHSSRSVYMRTQFTPNGAELHEFHDGLNKILQEGSVPRRDGTRKFEPFADDVRVAMYYKN